MECLIVEDDATIRMEYSHLFTSMGFAVLEVDRLEDAIYYLKTHDFRVILLDLQLHEGTSLPIADYLEVMGSEAIIILITGTGAFPRGECLELSPRIDYMLRKPVNLRDLQVLVEYATARPLVADNGI